ncbi:UNVERIFIED_CONTAM: hypothetical protein HDU68_009925 [Siphonaria sp. JEL0065]|nr:hypothetical protein HDU68_009925 [Siphonaria sp. JEL0065]
MATTQTDDVLDPARPSKMMIDVKTVKANGDDSMEAYTKLWLKLKLRTHDEWIHISLQESPSTTAAFVMTFHSHLFDDLKLDLFNGSLKLTRKHLGRGRIDFSGMSDWHWGSYLQTIELFDPKKKRKDTETLAAVNEPAFIIKLGVSFAPLVHPQEEQSPSDLHRYLERAHSKNNSRGSSVEDSGHSVDEDSLVQQSPTTNSPNSLHEDHVDPLRATRSHFIRTSTFHQVYNSVVSPTLISIPGSPATKDFPNDPLEQQPLQQQRNSLFQALKISSFPAFRKNSSSVMEKQLKSPSLSEIPGQPASPASPVTPATPTALSEDPLQELSTPAKSPATPNSSRHYSEELSPLQKSLPLLKKLAKPRILNEDTHLNISEVNDLAQSLLKNNFNLPVSRIVKVLAFLYKFENGLPIPRTGNLIKEQKVLEVAERFMDHSLVVYGALMSGFCTGAISVKDNLRLKADEKTALEYLKLNPANLLYWDHSKRTISTTRYYIVHDTTLNAIVISIQGTISAFQLLTDINADYFPFHNGSVHKGIFRAAQQIFDNQLEALLGWVQELKVPAIYCTGHSLGAGTCALLTLLLDEQRNRFVDVSGNKDFIIHAHAFATPGVTTRPVAEKCVELIDNYIMENDIVPRMSFGTIFAFKELMLEASTILDQKGITEQESFELLALKRAEILKKHDDKLGMIPGSVYHIYKTVRKVPRRHLSRNGIENVPIFKDAYQTLALPAKEKPEIPHYVIEQGKAEIFQYLAPRRHILNHHMPWQYMKSLHGALTWIRDEYEEKNQ